MVKVSEKGIDYSDLEYLTATKHPKETAKEIEKLSNDLSEFFKMTYEIKKGKIVSYEMPIKSVMSLIRFLAKHPQIKMLADEGVSHVSFKSSKETGYIG